MNVEKEKPYKKRFTKKGNPILDTRKLPPAQPTKIPDYIIEKFVEEERNHVNDPDNQFNDHDPIPFDS